MQDFLLDLRYRLEYAALRLIAGLVRAAPMDVAVDVSAKAWRRIAPYDRRHKRALAKSGHRLSGEVALPSARPSRWPCGRISAA